jgi:hypothetical protein
LDWIDELLDQKATPDSQLDEKLELAILILKSYGDVNFTVKSL